jgi:hypothetical protein
MRRLRRVAPADRKKAPGGALDHRISERDVSGCVTRNRRIPAVSETHVDEIDISGFPQKEAVQSKADIARILAARTAAIHFGGHLVSQVLMPLAIARHRTVRQRIAEIDAPHLAHGLSQRLAENDRRGTRELTGLVHLSAKGEPVVGRAAPSQRGSVAAEIDGKESFIGTLLAKKADLDRPRPVRRFRNADCSFGGNRVANDLVVPEKFSRWRSIVRAHKEHLCPGGRIKKQSAED